MISGITSTNENCLRVALQTLPESFKAFGIPNQITNLADLYLFSDENELICRINKFYSSEKMSNFVAWI